MQPVIQVLGLSKSYSGKKVLNNIDISISKGEIFGLLGANGAGKSTAIECILGTKKPDSGEINILGMNPHTQRKKLFEHVGVQFQESSYPDKIRVDELCQETSCLYQNPSDYRSLLKQFKLENKSKSFVSELSGGQKQRLFVILALIPNPQVIFLDELTTGLDTKARKDVWSILQELKIKGMSIMLSSHFMDEVEVLCDKVGILKNGNFVFYGTIDEAISLSGQNIFEEAYLWFTGEDGGIDE